MLVIISAVFTALFTCLCDNCTKSKKSTIYDFKFDRPPALTVPLPSPSMAAIVNATFASPIANADYTAFSPADGGILSRVYNGISGLSVTVTLLLILVAYDQCELTCCYPPSPISR